jgi:tetrahydromethanopterin S-methyltransferase subunit B
MGRIFYGIYIGVFILALVTLALSNDQKAINSAGQAG